MSVFANLKADVLSKKNLKTAAIMTGAGTGGVLAHRAIHHGLGKIKFLNEYEEKHPKIGFAVKEGATIVLASLLGLASKRYVGDTAATSFTAALAGRSGARIVGRLVPPTSVFSNEKQASKDVGRALGVPAVQIPETRVSDRAGSMARGAGALPDGRVGRHLSSAELQTNLGEIRAA